MTVRTVADSPVGTALPEKTVHVDRATLVAYAGASLDRNRIHWDERFATSVGLPDVIAHGMFTMGAAATYVGEWAGDGGRVVELGTRFTKPVVVPHGTGADVVYSGVVKAVDEETGRVSVELSAKCGDDTVLGRCVAVVRLD